MNTTPSKSIFKICNTPRYERKYYYVHEFTSSDHIYGSFIHSEIDLTKEELLHIHNTKFVSCHVDHDEDFSKLNFELLYPSNEPVIKFVTFTAKELPKLLKYNIKFYCDYMDQGFDEITDFENKYDTYSDLIMNNCVVDEENNTVEYCSGETIFVNINDYDKIFC